MKSFDKLILLMCVVMFSKVAGFNLFFPLLLTDENRIYAVEINRFMTLYDHDPHLSNHHESMFILASEGLSGVQFFSIDEETDLLSDMFSQNSRHYVIRPVFNEGVLTGFFQFELAEIDQPSNSALRIMVNMSLSFLIVAVLAILFHIKYQIIAPFNQISHLPIALSKGQIQTGIPESKSRYFGNFIWGLNMMRETLMAHKLRELELLKDKKTMILSLSHDINTPLSVIKLSIKAILSGLYPDFDKQQKVLKKVAGKTVEIENFVADIVKISKEDLLTFDVKEQAFYLADVMDRLMADYEERLALQKTAFVVADFSNRLLSGDLERLIEVLQNLIENAIKYGDGRQIRLSFDIEENAQLIVVSNTGNTMPVVELVHIFESFWRGSNIKRVPGSGLGLYMSRKLMQQMGGDVYAYIEDGTFCVTVVIPIVS